MLTDILHKNIKKEEDDEVRKKSFDDIYARNWWGKNENGDASSGVGSSTLNTRDMINILNSVVDNLKLILDKDVITLLDASCGDMFWMPDFLRNRSDVVFTGYDITQSNIEAHKEKFRNETWTFKVKIIFKVGYNHFFL